MLDPMTRSELAEFYGVAVVTVDLWVAQGMPMSSGASGGPAGEPSRWSRSWDVSRRELAELFSVHPDTVTRKLRDGLSAAVVERGGRGEELIFDLRLAHRWWLAAEGHLAQIVLDDYTACARAGGLAMAQLSAAPVLNRLMSSHGNPTQKQPRRRAARERSTRT